MSWSHGSGVCNLSFRSRPFPYRTILSFPQVLRDHLTRHGSLGVACCALYVSFCANSALFRFAHTFNCRVVSNAEVLSFLNELEVSRQQNRPVSYPGVPTQKNLNDLYTVERQVLTYLRNTPSVSQGPNEINNFMQSLKEYSLTKGEKLMLLNLRPKTTAELNPVWSLSFDSRLLAGFVNQSLHAY